jgi:invasion protein IalB
MVIERLLMLILVGVAVILTAGPSAKGQVQEQAKSNSTAKSAPNGGEGTSAWVVACTETKGDLLCRAAQTAFFRQGNRNVRVTAVLEIPPKTRQPSLKLLLPLGVALPPGVALKFDNEPAKALAFQSCNPNGCIAEYSPTSADIAAMQNGSQLELAVRTPDKTSFTFNVSAAGFGAAYDKMTERK